MSKKKRELKKKAYKLDRTRMTILIIILTIFLTTLFLYLLVQFNIISPLKKISLGPKLFMLEDECTLVVGKLIHTIKDDNTCEFRCKTNCEVREMLFYKSDFLKNQGDCNECTCYCT
ncbi:hypothetical protein BMS3Abin17_00822 [archaeon BMS3Abin17]|nr:hypothetical protein BMS3Abin17_00822 [archaeon BMS3Abin17]HDZ60084.1 hypothetical protein [Candidatus Pacearchaeota archaeon]